MRSQIAAIAGSLVAMAFAAAACGSGSAATVRATPTAAAGAATTRGPRGGFGNRTPNPAFQTARAEGTPFGNRTPGTAFQTAIAEGTPRSALGFASAARGQILTAVADLLSIDLQQLRSELQAPGATIASVAEAHGQARAQFRQALIDAVKQRISAAVTSGALSQDQADQTESQFEADIDRLLDSPGGIDGAPAAATPTP